MKLLTAAVPCYNSQDYMRRAVESLLLGGDRMEILIVDDGSADQTGRIADEYARAYPGRVRALHQPNMGHGGAVMTGLQNASGLYFKVLDSDDWVDADALRKLLDALETLAAAPLPPDLLVSNYIYDKAGVRHKHTVRYGNVLPEGRVLSWADVGRFRMGQYILMHAAVYRTALLRGCGLSLPRHTFYVDNLFVYVPLIKVETLFYLNVDLYHYYIGREGQSVQEANMLRRIDEQLRVNRLMLEAVDLSRAGDKRKRRYMRGYLGIVTTISSVLLERAGTRESLEKKKCLWDTIRENAPDDYLALRWRPMGVAVHLPGRLGRGVTLSAYRLSRRIYGFN